WVFDQLVDEAVIETVDRLAPDDGLDVGEVDGEAGPRIDGLRDGHDEAIGVAVELAALPRMMREAMRGLEVEGPLDDHDARPARVRVICTPTASTMPSRTGVSLRTRTVTRSASNRASSSSRSDTTNVSRSLYERPRPTSITILCTAP